MKALGLYFFIFFRVRRLRQHEYHCGLYGSDATMTKRKTHTHTHGASKDFDAKPEYVRAAELLLRLLVCEKERYERASSVLLRIENTAYIGKTEDAGAQAAPGCSLFIELYHFLFFIV